MNINKTTKIADKVLTELRKQLKGYKSPLRFGGTAQAYPYLNGRERGWSVQVGVDLPAFSFACQRNCDEVVVLYEDPDYDPFKGNGGQPTDQAVWDARLHFNSAEAAAVHIAERLKALIDAKAVADALTAKDAAAA